MPDVRHGFSIASQTASLGAETMGLTHYWQRPTELPPELFTAAIRDAKCAVNATGIEIAGFDGSGPPLFRDDAIVFNGGAGRACEPFEVHQTQFDRRGRLRFSCYCKTEHAPYDLCVRVALIVLNHHLPQDIEVSSDDRSDDWADARALCQSVLGYGNDFRLQSA